MIKRSITGFFIAALFAGVVICTLKVHYIFFDVFVLLLMAMSVLEVRKAVKGKFGNPSDLLISLALILGCIAFFVTKYLTDGDSVMGVLSFLMVIASAALIGTAYFSFGKRKNDGNAKSTLLCLIYPCALMVFMLALNYLKAPYRSIALIMLFTVTPFTDVMAYLVGSTLKGKKLCPKISPKKTISGAIGGLFGGMMGGGLVILLTKLSISSWFEITGMIGTSDVTNAINCLLLGLGGSVCTQLGDILASYMKRKCEIKDYGRLLPGHGGIMDRIDGMIINAAFLFVYMSVLSIIW